MNVLALPGTSKHKKNNLAHLLKSLTEKMIKQCLQAHVIERTAHCILMAVINCKDYTAAYFYSRKID